MNIKNCMTKIININTGKERVIPTFNCTICSCKFTEDDISFIGEVNEEKLGCFNTGTFIPIISEKDLLNRNPDYLIVLPWHFKDFFINNEKFSSTKLVFPLPKIEIYG